MTSDWNDLYQGLCHLLLKYGTNDPYGNEDYWVVDDDWGEKQQKLCIFKSKVMQHKLLDEIQAFLKEKSPAWTVIIVLEIDGVPSWIKGVVFDFILDTDSVGNWTTVRYTCPSLHSVVTGES